MPRVLLQVQRLVRGALARIDYNTDIETQRLLEELESGLKYISSRTKPAKEARKPPKWKKGSSEDYSRQVVTIQKHIRGYLQRKAYRMLLIDKMYLENEEMFKNQLKQVEDGFKSSSLFSDYENLVPNLGDLGRISSYDMPRPLTSSRNGKFSPVKNKILTKQVHYDYDLYILAAREIQRVWRGYSSRKKYGGSLKRIKSRVLAIQRKFRAWRSTKTGQVEVALELIAKQSEMIARTFSSYHQLRNLVLIKDPTGKNSRFLAACEEKLKRVGVYDSSAETDKLKVMLAEERIQHKAALRTAKKKAQHWKDQYKRMLNNYLKGVKGLKSQIELSQRSSFERVSSIILDLARAKKMLADDP
mmetsp:Transcript_29331/g.52504  ORF Transcript_29331/g.52504 Transcript_29331/m.52504 type:complete len:359 (-) Transcript_29331:901-1977(-)|eukprot:CAMPEP_0204912002 /NCGR_PEP_ID=MMETSP1397-20131031/10227_1 /ASSEMBLY_ACC=CAM_ASM_000891 /TAXON_ID=49980 /ORGANISM="Climacostomum Climacostomum virens, Strain Stock W-24" /LENGTH=358 /DNA_ID=CAMNT_0052082757 /DNA_START=22 /DNA_END=1094 /DNA_ORIENTATION=-